jgi:hypothetical protein
MNKPDAENNSFVQKGEFSKTSENDDLVLIPCLVLVFLLPSVDSSHKYVIKLDTLWKWKIFHFQPEYFARRVSSIGLKLWKTQLFVFKLSYATSPVLVRLLFCFLFDSFSLMDILK